MNEHVIFQLFIKKIMESQKIEDIKVNFYSLNNEDDNSLKSYNINDIDIIIFHFYNKTTITLYDSNNQFIVRFTLSQYPHCCGILILSDVRTVNKGLGKYILNFAQALGIYNKKAILQYVANESQDRFRMIVDKYLKVSPSVVIRNPNSSNMIYLYNHDLTRGINIYRKTRYKLSSDFIRNLVNSSKLFPLTEENVEILMLRPID